MTHVQQLASEVWLITACPSHSNLVERLIRNNNPQQASFLDFFLFQGRFLTSYGSKAHGGEIRLLFLCVTMWGATPFNGLYGEAPPKRVTFYRLQVHERVRISLFEVMKG